ECAESAGPDSSYLGLLRDVCFMSAEAMGADGVPIEKILPCVAVAMIESVRSLVGFLNSEELIVLEDVLTPVPLSLDIVQTSYAHLKESEKIYGPYFDQLEHCLVQLSSETTHLQVLLLGMLEKVKVEVSREKHVVWLLGICRRLRDLGITLQGLDLKMLVSVRKFLVKTSLQYRDSLKNRLDIDQLLSDLCTFVVEWLSSLKQSGPAKDGNFTVEMKTAAFHIRLLDSLISKYGGYFDNCLKMVALMIAFLSGKTCKLCGCCFFLLGCPVSAVYFLNLGPAQRDGLLRHIWIAAEHLVSVLAESRDFCIVVLTLDVPEDLWCGYQLMLTTLMDYVVDYDDALRACLPMPGSGHKNILEAVFGAIDHCSLELQLPVSLESSGENGKPPRSIGPYEHLCTHMCRFLAALSPEHFGIAKQEIVHKLSHLFASSLSSENYVVQQTALHAFAQFAQATQYDAVISNAIEHPTLKALVTSFLTKDEMKTPFDWVTVVRTQLQVVESSSTDDYDCSSSDWSGSDDTDPNPEKRPKCEDNLNELFESIEATVSKLRRQDKGALQSRRSKLQWLQSQLNSIVEDL
ncbi:hypothetical protein HPB47_011730, partial [Ixodes persulcatus]